jgi:hypothetical protein
MCRKLTARQLSKERGFPWVCYTFFTEVDPMRYLVLSISFLIFLAKPLPVVCAQEVEQVPVTSQEAVETNAVDVADGQDIEEPPSVPKIYKPESEAAKKERRQLILKRKKAELARLKALQREKDALKRKEAERLKARAKASAEERRKIMELRKKREREMRDLKREQKVRWMQNKAWH